MVVGPDIIGVRLTSAAYAHGLVLALPEKVAKARSTGFSGALVASTEARSRMARPEGFEPPTY